MIQSVQNQFTPQSAYQFTGTGTVYSFTTVQEPPIDFEDQSPYVMALVKLDEGIIVTAQLTDLGGQNVSIGDRVEMVTRKLTTDGSRGMIVYGYKFRPIVA